MTYHRPPDERAIEAERERRRNRNVAVGVGGALLLAAVALVVALVALTREPEAVGPAPGPGSVGTEELADGAVTGEKLADGAVDTRALADESVTGEKLAPDAIGVVGRARNADTAANAESLGGVAAAAYLSGVQVQQQASDSNLQPVKGPLGAACPSGTRIVAGGATVEGATTGVGITRSSPDGANAWAATAQAFEDPGGAWRLVVTAVCAAGGG